MTSIETVEADLQSWIETLTYYQKSFPDGQLEAIDPKTHAFGMQRILEAKDRIYVLTRTLHQLQKE